jgi:hypothetical protein
VGLGIGGETAGMAGSASTAMNQLAATYVWREK